MGSKKIFSLTIVEISSNISLFTKIEPNIICSASMLLGNSFVVFKILIFSALMQIFKFI